MANILFLAHRIPYPPSKGDKIRSWHFLDHLCAQHTVHLGFYVDDPRDLKHVDFLRARTKSLCFEQISRAQQYGRIPLGLLSGLPLSVAAYPTATLRTYVQKLVAGGEIDLIFLYSGATAALIEGVPATVPVVADLVDVDSAKWAAYADRAHWPLSWIYRREARTLARFERRVAARAHTSLLVSDAEAALFRRSADAGARIQGIPNGVSFSQFDPDRYAPPPQGQPLTVAFTGAMDYRPNIDAVTWFCDQVWPTVRARFPDARFRVAGGPDVSAVTGLASAPDGIEILGFVEDMAAEIAAANVIVAPLQIARGIQNKVLEGMAMARAVVASSAAREGIKAVSGEHLIVADDPDQFAASVIALLETPDRAAQIGARARAFVVAHHSWQAAHAALDRVVAAALGGGS